MTEAGTEMGWLSPAAPLCVQRLRVLGDSRPRQPQNRDAVVVATTFLTLLIPLVQNAKQLIIVRLLTGLGAGGVVSVAFPIAAELMPAQHRRPSGGLERDGARSSPGCWASPP